MKLKFLITILTLGFCGEIFAQLTLNECYQKSESNYPIIEKYDLIEATESFTLKNISKEYLPQISVSGRATYQSEVVELPIEIPGIAIPSLPNDQYQIVAELSQLIWDGGAIKAYKQSVMRESEVSEQMNSVQMYGVKGRVNSLFFGILLLDAQIAQTKIYIEELDRNYQKISDYIVNGVAYGSDLDLVEVERLDAEKKISTLEYTKKAYLDMLSIMIGEQLSSDIKLVVPQEIEIADYQIKRRELELFDAQVESASIQKMAINASHMPKFGAFLQGGYGQPGLNMLNGSFSPYYIAGVKFSWNLGKLYTRKNSLKLIDLNIKNVEVKRAEFLYNTNLERSDKVAEIILLRDQITKDKKIVELRRNIVESSKVRVESGTMSIYDLLKEITLKESAEQSKVINRLTLLKALYDYKYITNN